MLKSTLSLIAVTAIVFGAETDSESEGSWSLPTSPRSVDMSLTGSPYSADASRGSAPMSLCSSAASTPTKTLSPDQIVELERQMRSMGGRGNITHEKFAAMLNNPQQ